MSFRYEPLAPLVVEDVSLWRSRQGSSWRIVGRSGSGKSTLATLPPRPLSKARRRGASRTTTRRSAEPDSPRRAATAGDRHPARVPVQDDSVGANIALTDPPEVPLDDVVQAAAKRAQIHDEITVDAQMGLRDAGPRRRLEARSPAASGSASRSRARSSTSLAILLLDEATSALDSLTDKVQDSLSGLAAHAPGHRSQAEHRTQGRRRDPGHGRRTHRNRTHEALLARVACTASSSKRSSHKRRPSDVPDAPRTVLRTRSSALEYPENPHGSAAAKPACGLLSVHSTTRRDRFAVSVSRHHHLKRMTTTKGPPRRRTKK